MTNKALKYNMIGLSVMGQVCLLLAAISGHAYQIDMHMYFFTTLCILTCLMRLDVIILSTVLVAIHHLSLYFLMPSFVFPSSYQSDFERVILHAVILLVEAGVILWLIHFISNIMTLNNRQKKITDRKPKCPKRIG